MDGVGGDGGGLEGGRGFVGVELDESDEVVDAGCCGGVLDDVWIWRLYDLGPEGGDCFVAEVCCHRWANAGAPEVVACETGCKNVFSKCARVSCYLKISMAFF